MPIAQHYGWMNDVMGRSMWMGPWGWILIIILAAIIIYALAGRGGRCLFQPSKGSNTEEKHESESPLDILKKRYASGEISREDFEQMKKDLSS